MTASAPESAPSLNTKPASPAATATPAAPTPTKRPRRGILISIAAVVVLALAALAFGCIGSRLSCSETEDAFVESHIVNVAPQAVSGRLCRLLVEENDRVEQGQALAEIDPVLYRDKVELARSKVDEAEAELRRQESSLARLRVEIPIQIEIAKRTLAAAKADQARATEALKFTIDEVEKTILEAQAGVDLAQADFVLAQQEYQRFTALYQREAVPLERSQQVTRARDVAQRKRTLRSPSSRRPRRAAQRYPLLARHSTPLRNSPRRPMKALTWRRRATIKSKRWNC